ncbi:BtrH N-terminal domain-containing protein [bacterium]|nr:BtrH N-terminal domain-containing protein [bacterium]
MQRMIEGFRHEQGFHCGSGSLRNLLRHFGRGLSEPMCLGIGMAPAFFYFEAPRSPSRVFMGRSPTMEEDFFRLLGIDAPIRRHENAVDAWRAVRAAIDEGRPVLLQVDIRHMPYFNTRTHFPGHKVLLVGYDESAGDALISDTEYPGVMRVPLDELAKARTFHDPLFDLSYQWWDVRGVPAVLPVREAARAAITELPARMLPDGDFFGVPAMRRCADALSGWADAQDWAWCARFAYQIIEKRGTGGASFRAKYADFLREAAANDADVARLDLAGEISAIAALWTRLASQMKSISEREHPGGFDAPAATLREIADAEERYFRQVMAELPEG